MRVHHLFALCLPVLATASPAMAVVDSNLPRQVDLMVMGIVLDHTESSQNAFGIQLKPDDPDAIRPRMALCNHDKDERLLLDFYERDTATIISEMRVEEVRTKYVECLVPPQHIDHFDSGKGIHLGMSRKEVTDILGRGYHESTQRDEVVIFYRIDDRDSALLQRHNAPAYYGQYHFRDNRLVRYDIGFEFP